MQTADRGRESGKRRAASNCERRSLSPNSTIPQPAPPTPTPSSRLRSRALRRRPKCPRSPRRRRCSWRSRRPDAVKAEAAQRRRGAQLRVAYGNALIATRGFGAPGNEGSIRLQPVRPRLMTRTDAPERLAANYGLWASSCVRRELPSMRTLAAAFLRERGKTRFARGRRRAPHPRGHNIGSPASTSRRATSGTRPPCSTGPKRQSRLSLRIGRQRRGNAFPLRLCCGRWATSGARFPSSATLRTRSAGPTPYRYARIRRNFGPLV